MQPNSVSYIFFFITLKRLILSLFLDTGKIEHILYILRFSHRNTARVSALQYILPAVNIVILNPNYTVST